MTAVMGMALVSCGKNSAGESKEDTAATEASEPSVYNITACLEEDNEYNQILLQGFQDSLTDYLGSNAVVNVITADENTSTDSVAASAVSEKPDMIYTIGKRMLLSTTTATEDIPIVATGVVDFKGTLRIANTNGSSWDRLTGINVTGVSSKPAIVDQVSLMIEATDDLQTVGLLFSPEDTDSIYQNEIFESYLDQAGIPWKEYIIPATDTAIEEIEDNSSEAITPNKIVASSAKAGIDDDVVSLGESDILGINSPSSTRVASISEFWTGGKVVENLDETTEEDTEEPKADSDDSSEDKEKTNDTSLDSELTIEERIQQACDECSAIYIPFGSMLTDQMETISAIANENQVVTVGGDTTIGQHTLVTLFSDPYALGYAAGKKAVKCFNGTDITEIKVSYGSSDDVVKLYNKDVADIFGKEFPKSFSEFNEFLSTYEYGSTTARYAMPVGE